MMFFKIFIISAVLAALVQFALFQIDVYRLDKFSEFLKCEIERIYHARLVARLNGDVVQDYPYPNSRASYQHFDRTSILNWNFSQMIVYEKE